MDKKAQEKAKDFYSQLAKEGEILTQEEREIIDKKFQQLYGKGKKDGNTQ